jgi:hypothetical protein
MAKKAKAKPGPKPKIPKALSKILENAKPHDPPIDNHGVAAILGKGIKAVALEAGAGAPAIMTESGEVRSLLTPFGRPPGQPMLQPEKESAFGDKFDGAWGEIAAKTPAQEVVEEQEEEPEEEDLDPFADIGPKNEEPIIPEEPETTEEPETEEEPTQFEIPEPPSYLDLNTDEILEEMADLRRQNTELREKMEGLDPDPEGGEFPKLRPSKETQDGISHPDSTVAAANAAPSIRLPEWKGKDLRILFPVHKTTNPATCFFLLAMALDFGRDRIGFLPAMGDARIANARNRLADDFMKSGATWGLMVDDDMIPTFGRAEMVRQFIGATPEEVPDSVLNVHVVERLMSHSQKLVGATYFGRRRYAPAMFKDGIDNRQAYDNAKRHTGVLIPTEWVATGCLLIHRDVFLGIQKACPELAPGNESPFWDYFQEGHDQSGGEDVMFCKRAKKAGFQAYVDTGAQAFHVGFCAYGFHNTTYPPLTKGGGPTGIMDRESGWYKR